MSLETTTGTPAPVDVAVTAGADVALAPDAAGSSGAGSSGAGPRPAMSLSPSRAADFLNCPLLYRFRVIDRLPERPSSAATRGTVVHSVLERLFDLPAAERTPERAGTMLRPEWERLLAEEPVLAELFTDDAARDAWLLGAQDLLGAYFALEDPQRLEPAERELFVECDLESGLRLRGYIDRLDVAPGGEVRVVDYKTGRAPREGYEAKALFQMKFYALVLWRLRGEIPRMLQLLYLGSGEVLRYEPDESDLRAIERKLGAIWEAISRATERRDWRPSPSKLCDWCDHQALCPAFGGTPPELPVLPVPTVPQALAADERPSPHTPGDEL
jgi:putative RecB family exonuclease